MSSPAPRRSADTFASTLTSPIPNQYPFPNTSSQPSNVADRNARRRDSATSPITSNGKVLDPETKDDSIIIEESSNAISTLLQPYIGRTDLLPQSAASTSSKQPSAKDIPPVALTNIPHVENSAFTAYLKQAESLYDIFRRAKEGDGDVQIQGRRSRVSSRSDQRPITSPLGYQRRQESVPSTPLLEDPPVMPSLTSERPQAKRQHSGRRRGPLPVAPLTTIPNVYYEPDFHLENPRTFDVVSERSEIVRPSIKDGAASATGLSGRKALATNAILQEKLSWYMDTVEVHLISSISAASSSFFTALGSLRELHVEAAASVAKIKELRKDLASLDRNMAQGGLKIVALRKRQDNLRKLGNAAQQLHEIVEALARCEEQVDKGEIEAALDGLAMIESLIAGERKGSLSNDAKHKRPSQEQLINLRGIRALEGSDNDIAYLRQKIGKTFESRFLDSLLGDLRSHIDSVPANVTFERWSDASQRSRGTHTRKPSVYPMYLQINDSLRSPLKAHLEGLAKSDCLKQATTAYRDALWREVKTLIRRHLPSSSDEDMESTISGSTQGGRRMTQQEKSTILARNLRDLDAENAEEMLKKIYSNVGEALRRLGTQVKVVLDITSTFNSQPTRSSVTSPMSPPIANMDGYISGPSIISPSQASAQQDDIQQTLDMSNLLGQAVDIAQAQITKVLKVRSDQSSQLPLQQFLRYFNLNRLFADECEAVSGRGGTALKTLVNAHIKDFVNRSGDGERQRLVKEMDADRWDAKDVTESYVQSLDNIITASTQEVEAWTKGIVVQLPYGAGKTEQHSKKSTTNGIEQPQKDKVRSAVIDEQRYILPQSALTVLCGIAFFEQIITGIPSMTYEVTMSLLEYLKLFNSRSSQLILGAGATRSAGLKNITTKHLAIASQALSFIIALIPYVREFVRRHQTNPQGLMIEFDKLKRLYQEHQSGINDKLVDIMTGRAATHVNAMKKIDWDASSSDAVSSYMETLVKETTTLHKVLSKHLPEMTVRSIMDPVFKSYREQWHQAFGEVDVKTAHGKERILRDLEYFKSRISKLEGASKIGEAVLDVVNEKPVAGEKTADENAMAVHTPTATVNGTSQGPDSAP